MADVCRLDKSSPGFTCAMFRNLHVDCSRCSKVICRFFLSYNICTVLLFDQIKEVYLLTVKSLQNVIHVQIILLHLPRATDNFLKKKGYSGKTRQTFNHSTYITLSPRSSMVACSEGPGFKSHCGHEF